MKWSSLKNIVNKRIDESLIMLLRRSRALLRIKEKELETKAKMHK